MSRVQPRTYDLAEANAVLPEVRGLVERIVELGTNLPDLEDAVAVDAEHDRHTEALREAELELAGALTTLEAMGVQLKDMRLGLIDFLSYREGELVELCWKLGEDRVAFWHRIGEGFAGRQPIA
jgi:hypothetical protein